jgi:hypothetical protein
MSLFEFKRYVKLLKKSKEVGVDEDKGGGSEEGVVSNELEENDYVVGIIDLEDGVVPAGGLYGVLSNEDNFRFSEGKLLKMGLEPISSGQVIVIVPLREHREVKDVEESCSDGVLD